MKILKPILRLNLILILNLLLILNLSSQEHFLNLNREFNRNIEKAAYSMEYHFHTSMQPFYVPELEEVTNYDSITKLLWWKKSFNKKWKQKTWDKVFNDDVVTLRKQDFAIVANPLMNFTYGKESVEGKTIWTNTRGIEVKGRIGKNRVSSFCTSKW